MPYPPTYFAGGGASAGTNTIYPAGLGGGGQGDNAGAARHGIYDGQPNTGGGAGGCGGTGAGNGNNGGSGVVIFSYPDYYNLPTATTGSPTIETKNGLRVIMFTASGSITW